MLKKTLQEKYISVRGTAMGWEEAIHEASRPLLAGGIIEACYVEKMIENVKEWGPYIVVAPRLALAHARPEDGVKQLGLSLLLCEEAVSFSDKKEHEVYAVFVLAAPTVDAHLQLLSELAELLGDSAQLEALCRARTVEEILVLLRGGKG